MNNLYDVLEVCLQDVQKGVDIETILFGYPDLADELRPILETAAKAIQVQIPDPFTEVVRRNRAQLLQQAAQMREVKAGPSRKLWSVSVRRALVSLAVIAALFIGSTSLVRASTLTLPGDNLYPVKRTLEDVRVLFTFDVQAREALEVEHENERLEELYEIFAEGRSAEVDFAGLVTRQNGDLWLVAKIPVAISAQTDLHDGPVVTGDAVRVRGVTQADGTVLAKRVDLLDAGVPLPEVEDNSGNENESNEDNSGPGSGDEAPQAPESERDESKLEGTVDSVNGNIVIVNNQPMDISNAEVSGTAAVGVRAKVEGYYDANGVFIVTKIEFGSSDSGGGEDSGLDDNGSNDNNDDHGGNSNDNDDDDNGGGGGDDDNGSNSGSGGGDDD